MRLCKAGHDMDVVGTTSNRGCRKCAQLRDRKRAPQKRRVRKEGYDPQETFGPGYGYVYDNRGFRWKAEVVETKGRLRAVCETHLKRSPQGLWADLFRDTLAMLAGESDQPQYEKNDNWYWLAEGGYKVFTDDEGPYWSTDELEGAER